MTLRRFGKTVRLPSTIEIKRELLVRMFADEVSALQPGAHFREDESVALALMKRLTCTPAQRD